jgi:hypothetical protein
MIAMILMATHVGQTEIAALLSERGLEQEPRPPVRTMVTNRMMVTKTHGLLSWL